jgi:Zn-dependent protease with chaperone function
MDIHGFLNSYFGNYAVQSFFHSLTAAVLVGVLLRLWKIENPLVVQKFRSLVILLPLFSFPVYYLLNPVRGHASFRTDALFDSSRWLDLALWGRVPVSLLLISLVIGALLVLACQELIAVARQWAQSKKESYPVKAAVQSPVKRILSELHAPMLDNYVIESNDQVLFTTLTGPKPTIVLSLGLLRFLSYDQLKAALGHEVAHAIRNNRVFLSLLLLVRFLMFYNPVMLFAFKAASLDEEKICDDIAAFWTGKPQVLADTLKRFYIKEDGKGNPTRLESAAVCGTNMMIKARVERLERKASQQVSLPWLKFALTLLTIVVINYYIV